MATSTADPFEVNRVMRVGALPVIKRFCDRLELSRIVDEAIPLATQASAGAGDVLVAMVMNKLTDPLPLYRIQEWAEESGVEPFLGLQSSLLTDDRIGRLLDRLADHVEPIKTALCVSAVEKFGLDVGRLHWDLTSVQFEGAYDDQDPLWPRLTTDGRSTPWL